MKKEPQEKSYLLDECDKVGEVAIHYGFTAIKPPHIATSHTSESKPFRELDIYTDAQEKIALTHWYVDAHLINGSQPVLLHYKKPLGGSAYKKKSSEEMYGLEIMGSTRSECEALSIKTCIAILNDLGYKDVCVDINSIGDRESINKFERELMAHFRREGGALPAKAKQEFKKNHYQFLRNLTPETEGFIHTAPQTIGALSDISRTHFKEVLEYLEAFGIMYKINNTLFSNKTYATQTVFEIRDMKDAQSKKDGEGSLLAYGYRYNYLAKKIGSKKEIPSVGATIIVKKDRVPQKKILIKNIKKPRFYLVQLGNTAKLKALNVIELLRAERIPVYHSLTKDKITGQLTGAEYMRATHVLIIGQKEAIENSVVVRHVHTREQETVFLHELVDFLRKIEKELK